MENSKTNVNNLDYSDTIQCTLPQVIDKLFKKLK